MCHLRHRLRIFLFHRKVMYYSQDIQVFVFLNILRFTKSIMMSWWLLAHETGCIFQYIFWSIFCLLEVLILNVHLNFWNSNSKINFGANLGRKSQSYPFYLKIGAYGISRMLILIPTLVFWISKPKSIFGQVWTKKVKVLCFVWKLAWMVSWGYWFLFSNEISKPRFSFGQS